MLTTEIHKDMDTPSDKNKELIGKIQHRFTKMIKVWRVNRTMTD